MDFLIIVLLIVVPIVLLFGHLEVFDWWSNQYENDKHH